jgi:hypothetical protein
VTFTEEFVTYARESTDSPETLLWWGGILAISSVLGRKVFFRHGRRSQFPNLWLLLVGPSSIHKSTALDLMLDLAQEINTGIEYPQDWSTQSLFLDIQNMPHGMFVYDEAKQFFDICSQTYNIGSMSMITSLFERGTCSVTRVKKEKGQPRTSQREVLNDAYLCFGGASTAEWLLSGIQDKKSAVLSGFLPRFLFAYHAEQIDNFKPWFVPPDETKRVALLEKLRCFCSLAGEMTYHPDAGKLYEQWYGGQRLKSQMAEKSEPMVTPFLNKIRDVYSHKLAMIAAVDIGDFPVITPRAWHHAEKMLDMAETSIRKLVGSLVETSWDKMRRLAVEYLSKQLDCSREEFGDATKIRGKLADNILMGLQNDGKIMMKKVEKSTKPLTVIQWVGNGNG